MKKQFRYKNILLYSSLQFTGNIEEYFSQYSEKLVSYIIEPKSRCDSNLIRVYQKGKLISEDKFSLPKNAFLYYLAMYLYQLYFLIKYFSRNEKVFVITFHPISFFGMGLQRMIRNIVFVYWVADYFPPVNTFLRLFEALKRFYNKRVDYVCYLSNIINRKMNGKPLQNEFRKTVMWGINPQKISRVLDKRYFSILFVGVVRGGQGLEFVFNFLKTHKSYFLNIIGDCEITLFDKYQNIIAKNNIGRNVFFPNRFFSNRELEIFSQKCQVGVALYDTGPHSATYYTDPGKIKAYTQLGLPIIMSDTSAIAPYIKKFQCGEVIRKNNQDLNEALLEIRNNYMKYLEGLKKFNQYFYFDSYYKKSFKFMEKYE